MLKIKMKKTVVISLGGSLIVPEKTDFKFLSKFKRELRKYYPSHRFVVVCGGGTIARRYISALRKEGKSKKELANAGIKATRMNATFMIQFFGKEANDSLPKNMKEIKSNLSKNNVVICGALRYAPNSTSDGTAAKLASFLKTEFINMTNVKGLYTANPRTHKNAKFIPEISWVEFEKRALKLKFKAAQHFVLDQQASVIIRRDKITTYIIGPNPENLNKILKCGKFTGTLIEG